MKKIVKPNISNILTIYANIYPQNTWDNFRNSGWEEQGLPIPIKNIFETGAKGLSPYKDIQEQLFQIQGGICAYCEQDFSSSYGSEHYIQKMIEHFHPKRDHSKNWGLDWNNLLGCCDGGSSSVSTYPAPKNLSCDKYKEYRLDSCDNVEECILNPIQIPAFPCLFKIDKFSGKILSNPDNCNSVKFQTNKFQTTKELVDNTIAVLNLNCDRLLNKRKQHIDNYENQIRQAKINNNRYIYEQLCERYLSKNNGQYHSFFTTYRILLGNYAEDYLEKYNFSG